MTLESVLVLGAGELGIEVLRGLAAHTARNGTRLIVFKRGSTSSSDTASQRHTADELDRLGIEVQRGDVVALSEEQLAAIFRRYEVVISCTGMYLPPDTQIKLAKAAIRAGVKRYFPWQFGLDYDRIGRQSSQNLFDAQLDVRDLLRGQSTIAWVIVSTGVFTSFLFEPAFGVVDEARATVTALGSWGNRVTGTTPADIGRITAEIVFACPEAHGIVCARLDHPDAIDGRNVTNVLTRYAAGDTISMEVLADTIDTVLVRKLRRELATVAELEAELATDPDNGSKKYRAVFAAGVGTAWEKAKSFNAMRGLSTQTVEQWARGHLE